MPLKVYVLVACYSLIGVGLLFILSYRTLCCINAGRRRAALGYGGLLVACCLIAIFLSSHLLPCFNLFHQAFCRGPADQKWIALSFDDGPNEPFTSRILDVLAREGVSATFFLVGENLQRQPELLKRLRSEGHEIGNHTFTHTPVLFLSAREIRQELEAWEKLVGADGGATKLFRAPRGWKSPFLNDVLKQKNYQLIGWTRGVWDTDQPGEAVLWERLSHGVDNGEIILLHDGMETQTAVDRSDLLEVLPRVIKFYRDRGYRFVTISEMLDNGRSSAL